jgi:hypothetical protein
LVTAQNNKALKESKFKRSYSKKEVLELFKKYSPKKRDDLNVPDLGFSYYELPDGRILIIIGEKISSGKMYKSVTELNEICTQVPFRKDGEHVLSNLIPDDNKFLASINLYIDSLADKLGIPREKLDRSLKSITLIDTAYNKERPSQSVFFNKDYLYLIAYLGEVFKHEKGGDWFFKRYPDEDSYQPYIKVANGRILNPFLDLFKDCYENFEKMSIYDIADFAISDFRLGVLK